MTLNLPGLLYGIIFISAANIELRAKDSRPLTALLSLGLTQVGALWKMVDVLLRRLNPFDQPTFDRRNPVHRAAGLLLMAHLTWTIGLLLKLGNTAETFFARDLGGVLLNLAASMVIYISLSALGTGWRIRRGWLAVLQRLGLRQPTLRDCLAGLVFGLLIFMGMTVASVLLLSATSADQSGAQMDGSRPLFDIVKGSLPVALLVAILAGTGEEIFFRGALQPVFGLIVSSLFFTVVHLQYGLSPQMLILFFVSLGLGLVRQRFSTTAAIIAHTTYDFLPFLIYSLLP